MSATGALDAAALEAELDARGFAVVPGWFSDAACAVLNAGFDDDRRYRKTIVMEAHGYGRGTYRYFEYPLPPLVAAARAELYAALVPAANAWAGRLGVPAGFPPDLGAMLARAHAAGQERPTPLVLRYHAGDFNALHQDLYGDIAFPLQGTVLLTEPGRDFTGGEFVLVEARPRRQSVAHVVPLERGDLVVFPNAHKPNARGGRSTFRHGVSEVRSGERTTFGLILHDAR